VARSIVEWVELECELMRADGGLAAWLSLPPNLFPYIHPGEEDWHSRMGRFNRPGEYHNGGIWPFINGYYIGALIACGEKELAEKALVDLSRLCSLSKKKTLSFGFNEWIKAQTGEPYGQDWQTWSAAMYLFAYHAVKDGSAPFFSSLILDRPGETISGEDYVE